jgi:hypothetical protein
MSLAHGQDGRYPQQFTAIARPHQAKNVRCSFALISRLAGPLQDLCLAMLAAWARCAICKLERKARFP